MVTIQRRKAILIEFASELQAGRPPMITMREHLTEEELLWLGRLLGYMAQAWAHDIETNERLLEMGAMPGAPGNDADGWWASEIMTKDERDQERRPYILDEEGRNYIKRIYGGVREERANLPHDRVGEFDN